MILSIVAIVLALIAILFAIHLGITFNRLTDSLTNLHKSVLENVNDCLNANAHIIKANVLDDLHSDIVNIYKGVDEIASNFKLSNHA